MDEYVDHDNDGLYIISETSKSLVKKYELIESATYYISIISKRFISEQDRYALYAYDFVHGYNCLYMGNCRYKFKILLNLLGKRKTVFKKRVNKLRRGGRFEAYLE